MYKYHVNLKFSNKDHAKWNFEKNQVISDFVIPFITGQVVLIERKSGKKLLNMKSVSSLTVYRTSFNLHTPRGKTAPVEFQDPDFAQYECTGELLNEIRLAQANHPVRSLIQKTFSPPENKVFVIMKFGDKVLDAAYTHAIEPLVKELGMDVVRIDKVQNSGKINEQVLEEIATSKYVVADLTGERPNCYYECGFGHALGKEMIFTVRSNEKVHFDLLMYRHIVWDCESELRTKLTDRFVSLLQRREWQHCH